MHWIELIPSWVIAGVALAGAVQSFRNRRVLADTHVAAIEARAAIAEVRKQTDGMTTRLEKMSRQEGKAEGIAETEAKNGKT